MNLYYITSALLGITFVILLYYKWRYQYWKNRNIPYLQPKFPYGNLLNPLFSKISLGLLMKSFYDQIRANGWKYCGIYSFTRPILIVADLSYVRNVFTKDFEYFVNRGFYYNEKDDPLSAHLFAIGGLKWRNLRTKLTPTFTSGKMKMMFQAVIECQKVLQAKIEKEFYNGEPIDIKNVMGCFTTDVIGNCAFGLDFNSIQQDDSPFRKHGKKAIEIKRWDSLKFMFSNAFPALANFLKIRVIAKDTSDFFMKIVTDTVNYREKNQYSRKDFMQLLIDLRNTPNQLTGAKSLTLDELAAQSFLFFIAGFETSSTTMAFVMYELARNPDIQDRVKEEIDRVLEKYNGEITYEGVQETKYLNQVIDESLRLYPPLPVLTRDCVKDYKLPDGQGIIEKGTRVIIPVLGLHHDEDNFKNPHVFDPERFNEENKKLVKPYSYVPFGEGPRICIGLRFGLIQTKIGLISLLKDYKFSVHPKTQEPIRFTASSFISSVEGEIWLSAEKR